MADRTLAERAAACIVWAPGMRATGRDGVWVRRSGLVFTIRSLPTGALPRIITEDGFEYVLHDALPDLEDDATVGCILAQYDATRRVRSCPDPVYTYIACYGMKHPVALEALISALEAARANVPR